MNDPTDIVRQYLEAMAARDFTRARGFLATEVEMVFPGGRRFSAPETIAANSGGRYARIAKRIDGYDVAVRGDTQTVYCYGTLSGEWRDGEGFSDIRFIDRFTLVDGKITGQYVWNDAGEARLARAAS